MTSDLQEGRTLASTVEASVHTKKVLKKPLDHLKKQFISKKSCFCKSPTVIMIPEFSFQAWVVKLIQIV